VSFAQLKVMSAIETCRTSALGGHVERCEDCAHERIAYNSCLMGTFSNGELAFRRPRFSVKFSNLSLHDITVLRLRRLSHQWPVTNGDDPVGDLLLGIEDAGASTERAKQQRTLATSWLGKEQCQSKLICQGSASTCPPSTS
jgi:hypothetical protein